MMFLLLGLITIFTHIVSEQNQFVIVIPSFNNSLWCKENLDSVFMQQYQQYRVIYIDDCSTDNTAEFVEDYVQQCGMEAKFTLIKNIHRVGALENIWKAIHSCNPDEIIVSLDGDDTFAHEYVLSQLDDIYQNNDVWLTYGQFQLRSNRAKGWCVPIPQTVISTNTFRSFSHIPSHLRTFYAWLFQEIKLEDLITHRRFYSMTWDIAMMMPMIEMAGERHMFIDNILYIYNDTTPINDDKINKQLQSYLARVIRAKKPYKRLHESTRSVEKKNTVSCVVISQENPMQLFSCLESIVDNCKQFEEIQVLYRSNNAITEQEYQKVMKQYSFVIYHKINQEKQYDLKQKLLQVLKEIPSPFTVLTTDYMVVTRTINLKKAAQLMHKTHAYAFHFRLGKNITQQYPLFVPIVQPHLIEIEHESFAWNFKYAEADWAYASNLDFTLYQTKELCEVVSRLYFNDTNNFEIQWANSTDIDYAGLCFAESCAEKVLWKKKQGVKKNQCYQPHELTKIMANGCRISSGFLKNHTTHASRSEHIPIFITME